MKKINTTMAFGLALGLLTGGAAQPARAESASSDQSATTTQTTQTTPTSRRTQTTTTQTTETQRSQTSETPRKHPVLMYIPNRIFDVLDIVRARVRLGPGISVGARVTSIVTVFVGGHSTAYVGVPGPRGKPEVSLPFGLEDNSGPALAPTKESEEQAAKRPYYGPMEIGAETQALIAGISVGVEPLEALDLLSGIFFIDLKGDDF
jgi:hypothetical protein